MRAQPAIFDTAHVSDAHAVVFGDCPDRALRGPYRHNLRGRNSAVHVGSIAPDLVVRVLLRRPDQKMRWIYAPRIVAGVADNHASRNGAIRDLVRETGRTYQAAILAMLSNHSVSAKRGGGSPRPTFIWAASVYLSPKAINQRPLPLDGEAGPFALGRAKPRGIRTVVFNLEGLRADRARLLDHQEMIT